MARKSISPIVLDYLKQNPDEYLTLSSIAAETGLLMAQVSNAVITLRTQGYPVETTSRGVYRWHSGREKVAVPQETKSVTKPLYEYLAVTKSGRTLVQSEDGTVYALTELD